MSDSQATAEFARLFDASQAQLLRYILNLVPSDADALDLLQETAAALWLKFDQYDREKPFGPWARKFAHYQVLKWRLETARRHEKVATFSLEAIEVLSKEFERHDEVLQSRIDALAGCVEQMSTDDRTLLEQRYWEHVNLESMSTHTGMTPPQISRRLYRIRRQLEACIDRAIATEGVS